MTTALKSKYRMPATLATVSLLTVLFAELFFNTLAFDYNTDDVGVPAAPVYQRPNVNNLNLLAYFGDEAHQLGGTYLPNLVESHIPFNLLTEHVHCRFQRKQLDKRWAIEGVGGGSPTAYSIDNLMTDIHPEPTTSIPILKLKANGLAGHGLQASMPALPLRIEDETDLIFFAWTPFFQHTTASDWNVEMGVYLDGDEDSVIRWRTSNQTGGITNSWLMEHVEDGVTTASLPTGHFITKQGGISGDRHSGERNKFALSFRNIGGTLKVVFWKGLQPTLQSPGVVDWDRLAEVVLPAKFLPSSGVAKISRPYVRIVGTGIPKEFWLEDFYAIPKKEF